ncbi:hypothetical protein ACPC54_23820 [Kitasatospora sp. NPDC094028]
MTDTPPPAGLRDRIDAAIRPAMLIGLQDAELHDEPGRERIGEWADSITEWVLAVVQLEVDQHRTALVNLSTELGTITAVARSNAECYRTAVEEGERLRAELATVRQLHQPRDHGGQQICTECSHIGHITRPWPCRTAAAFATTTNDPLVVRWDRTVIPSTPGDDTIVCCLTGDGRPVALLLDDEHREALGLQLVDPEGC